MSGVTPGERRVGRGIADDPPWFAADWLKAALGAAGVEGLTVVEQEREGSHLLELAAGGFRGWLDLGEDPEWIDVDGLVEASNQLLLLLRSPLRIVVVGLSEDRLELAAVDADEHRALALAGGVVGDEALRPFPRLVAGPSVVGGVDLAEGDQLRFHRWNGVAADRPAEVVLQSERVVVGVTLPSGSAVRFDEEGALVQIEPSEPSTWNGLSFVEGARIDREASGWAPFGELAQDATYGGVPLHAGDRVEIMGDGALRGVLLAHGTVVDGKKKRKGSVVEFDPPRPA